MLKELLQLLATGSQKLTVLTSSDFEVNLRMKSCVLGGEARVWVTKTALRRGGEIDYEERNPKFAVVDDGSTVMPGAWPSRPSQPADK